MTYRVSVKPARPFRNVLYNISVTTCFSLPRLQNGKINLQLVAGGYLTEQGIDEATSLKQAVALFDHLKSLLLAKYSITTLPVAINYNGSNARQRAWLPSHVGSMRSPSRGRVQVTSKTSFDHPSIFNYMSTEQDWQELRDAIRITREIMQQPALDPYRGEEISPEKMWGDAELDEFVRNHAETAYHPSCSCKMGEDDMAVVDGQGRVHGLQSLRVVDASIMPLIITGNLNATTIMMAEKSRIKSEGPHSPTSFSCTFLSSWNWISFKFNTWL